MDSITMLKRRISKQQKQIDALTTTLTFMFGFLLSSGSLDLSMTASALGEMLADPDIKDDEYLRTPLARLEEVCERVMGGPVEKPERLPSWFRGIIKGGLSKKDDVE